MDPVNYLDSLGKTQTAKVKRDADVGVAEANRDAGIRVNYTTDLFSCCYIVFSHSYHHKV